MLQLSCIQFGCTIYRWLQCSHCKHFVPTTQAYLAWKTVDTWETTQNAAKWVDKKCGSEITALVLHQLFVPEKVGHNPCELWSIFTATRAPPLHLADSRWKVDISAEGLLVELARKGCNLKMLGEVRWWLMGRYIHQQTSLTSIFLFTNRYDSPLVQNLKLQMATSCCNLTFDQ